MEPNLEGAVPAVDPEGLRRWWNFAREAPAAWKKEHPDDAGGIGFDASIVADVSGCSDALAVTVRASLIEILSRQGVLGPWLEDGRPTEAVFRLAAEWPIPDLRQLNPQEFLNRLRAE